MKMQFKWAVGLVAIAIGGLVIMQFIWLNDAYRLNQEEFSDKVNSAMMDVGKKIESEMTCFEMFSKVYIKPGEGVYMLKHKMDGEEYLPTEASNLDTVNLNFLYNGKKDTSIYSFADMAFSYPATAEVTMRFQYILSDTAKFQKNKDQSIPGFENLTANDYRQKLDDTRPLADRMDITILDSLIGAALKEKGINNDFTFGIKRKEKYAYLSKNAKPEILNKSALGGTFFNGKYFGEPFEIKIDIEDQAAASLASIKTILFSSAVLIIIFIATFLYFINTIRKQKKISEMKTDFINNMTHEFQTPISNISLALETVTENNWVNGNTKLGNILQIVSDENVRLRENVERILHIAVAEKQKFRLKLEIIDLTELLKRVVRNFEMQAESVNGQIKLNIPDEAVFVKCDETHLINVFCNLIDNALKYSPINPRIEISVSYNEKLYVTISDNGIGMTSDEQKRIFEKFYRVPTGNIHNVKGFGLGLSYTKNILLAHCGTIKVSSQIAEGSTFTVELPLYYAVKNESLIS